MRNFYLYIYLDPRKPGKYSYPDLGLSFTFEPIYVGKGSGMRIEKHLCKCNLKKNLHFPKVLNKIIRDGLAPIRFKIKENLTADESLALEVEFIHGIGRRQLNTGSLLNMTDGGEGGSPMKGRTVSDETKKKMSEAAKGRKFSEEHRKKLSDAKRGKVTWNTGRTFSDEHKQKLREARIKLFQSGYESYNKNQAKSDEERKKISESLKNYYRDNEVSNKGKKLEDLVGVERAEKLKEKMRNNNFGKTLSDEHKKKISEGMKRRKSQET